MEIWPYNWFAPPPTQPQYYFSELQNQENRHLPHKFKGRKLATNKTRVKRLDELDTKVKLNLFKVLREVLPMTLVRTEEMCFAPVEMEDIFAARKHPKIR